MTVDRKRRILTSSLRVYVSCLTHFDAQFARPASGFAVWGLQVQPAWCLSQALNPTFEALGLRRHKTGVVKGMSQDRYALQGGEQVHGKVFGVFPLPKCPKL